VVVAAGALEREAHERLAERADHLLEFVAPREPFHPLAAPHDRVVGARHPEPRGRGAFHAVGLQIAHELHPHEAVVGHVGVECVDDPVAVRPGVVAGEVPLEAVALAEPHDVEPVTPPAFAVGR